MCSKIVFFLARTNKLQIHYVIICADFNDNLYLNPETVRQPDNEGKYYILKNALYLQEVYLWNSA